MVDLPNLKPLLIDLAMENAELELLWLYGSQATGAAHEASDLDLAVVFKTWEQDPLERRLKPELLALDWQKKLGLKEGDLSILDLSQAPIPIAMSVLKTGSLLLSKNKSRQFREQQRIMSKWEIDHLYHYKNHKALYG